MQLLPRARVPAKVPVVLTVAEVRRVLVALTGVPRLVAMLLYGARLRLHQCLELRVKDLDFERREITVRRGKGQKDRWVMLPDASREAIEHHLEGVRRMHYADLAAGFGRVVLAGARDRNYPRAATDWSWQFGLRLGASVGMSGLGGGWAEGGVDQAGLLSHISTLVRHSPARKRV